VPELPETETIARDLDRAITGAKIVDGRVIRADVLRTTRLIDSYAGSDQTLLAELALRGEFHEVPERLFLRRLQDGRSPSLQANATRLFSLVSVCGVPPTATAVSANITVVGPVSSGALHVYPGDLGTAPTATAISFSPGVTRANNAILRLATDGSGTVAVLCDSGGTTDFIIDVNGYFE